MWRLLLPLLLLLPAARCVPALSDIDKGSLYGKKKKDRMARVTAVEGQAAELPCDVTPPGPGDSLRLVLWYYGTEGTIYTYDARGDTGASGSHWVSGHLGGDRLQFQADGLPASLRISAVSRADSGLYRCRVDFLLSPTQNSRVNLTVIVPPQKPVILDSSGRRLDDNTLGPYRLDRTANVTCAAFDGSPAPNVTWWRGGSRLGGRWWLTKDGSVRARLRLGPLTRADHGARITCMAAFHPFSSAVSTAVVVQMLLPPESVSLQAPVGPVVAGQPVTLTCQVTGSRPEPVISWRLGSTRLPAGIQRHSPDGNGTISQLTFTPKVTDQGQTVTCRATNPPAGDEVVEDALTLHVQYPPLVSLTYRPDRLLRAGQSVRLHCDVQAEPAVTQLRWRHRNTWLPMRSQGSSQAAQNGSADLVLGNVRADTSGNYTCVATNRLGTSESRPVTLRVQHAPLCASADEHVLEAARGETMNVTCLVTAFPEPLHFRWSFNSSDELLPQQEFSRSLLNSSTLSYTPRLASEFGSLLCWARNALGEQQKPCVYIIKPADVPDPPSACDVTSRSSSSLQVHCQPGFDGGSRQTFRLEVFSSSDHRLYGNVSSASPRLSASGLPPGQEYRLSVFALNTRGSSAASTLLGRTLGPEPADNAQHGSLVDLLQLTPILGVLIGIVTALVLTAVIIVGTRRCCTRPHAKENQQGVSHVQLVRNFNESGSFEEKQDPDLIPQKTEYLDPEEKHMIERLRNSRFPPPPARFGDMAASPGELETLSPAAETPPRSRNRVASFGTQTTSQSPETERKVQLCSMCGSSRRLADNGQLLSASSRRLSDSRQRLSASSRRLADSRQRLSLLARESSV